MKTGALLCKVIGMLTFASMLLVVVLFLSGEATVAWYMHHQEITSRLELSEDYGFGMLAFFVDFSILLFALPLSLIAGWRLSGRVGAATWFKRIAFGGR